MVHFISFGKYNKLYKYIWFFLIICLVNEYIFSDIFPDQIKPYIFETTNYPSNILIQGFFNYLGSFIFSIFVYLYEKSQLQKRENNNESKATSGILYRYEYIYYTKRLVESKINTIIFFSIILIISIESLNIFLLLNLDGITYWSFDLFFLSYINLKLFGVPIYSHKKFSIVFIAVFSTLFLIFSTYELLTNDNYNLIYKNHLFLIPILIVLYQFLSISRFYSLCIIKWSIDYKYIPVSIILLICSFSGMILLLIASLISSFIKCVDKTTLNDVDLICLINIKEDNKTDYYFDSFSFFFDKLRDKETVGLNILYIFLFLLKILLNSLRLLFSLLIIKHLNPEYYLCSFIYYYFIIRLVYLIKTIIDDSDIKVTILNLIAQTISLICVMIYLELIELNFCNLDRNLKKNIEARSFSESSLNILYNEEVDNN